MASPEDFLNDLDDPHKRIAAIIALGEIADAHALDRILSFTRDDDPQVRRAVMTALASFEEDRVMAAIIGGLHDADADVRAAAEAAWAKWVLKNMLQMTGADRGYVVMKNPESGTMEYRAGEKVTSDQLSTPEFNLSQMIIQESVDKQQPLLTNNAMNDPRYSGAQSVVGYTIRQIVAVPLKSGDEVVGVIYVEKRLRDGMLKSDELPALTNFADQAVALTEHPLPMAGPPEGLDQDDDYLMDDSLRGGAGEVEEEAEVEDLPDWLRGTVVLEDSLASEAAEPEAEAPREEAKEKAQKTITSDVNFSAYYPAEAVAKQEQGLFVYAHLPDLAPAIEQDVKQFKQQLGGSIPTPRVAKQSAQLQHGTLITVMPECDELEFEPAAVTKKWNGEWTRFDFAFTPKADMVGDSLFVRVSITVSGVEIARIKCPIDVVEGTPIQPIADNPLAAAKLSTRTASLYHRIFVSYSRKDTQVAEAYRLAQMAVGNDVFMDTYSIRVGEDWRAALARAIDDADIFQLFWSSHSAESDNVHDEWDYALKYKCPDGNCTYFIRPVFWDKPMPSPPQELSHLNFRYVPFDAADQDTGG